MKPRKLTFRVEISSPLSTDHGYKFQGYPDHLSRAEEARMMAGDIETAISGRIIGLRDVIVDERPKYVGTPGAVVNVYPVSSEDLLTKVDELLVQTQALIQRNGGAR